MENFKIRCLESRDEYFIAGKVYEVINGKIIDGGEYKRPFNDEKITCLDDIKNYGGYGSWGWIGEWSW